jgi:hypothetical protein
MTEGSLGHCDDDVAASPHRDDVVAASGHNEQSDETEDSEPEDAASHDNAKSFACHIMEEVVRGRVTVKGVTDMLQIFHGHYGKLLPRNTKVPTSWYKISKLAREDQPAPHAAFRDVCPECDYLFDGQDPTCPRCNKSTRWNERKVGEPKRQAVYFDLEHDLRTFFGVAVHADALESFATSSQPTGSVRDYIVETAGDGTILRALRLREEDPAETSDEEAEEADDEEEKDVAEDSSDPDGGDHGVSQSGDPDDEDELASDDEEAEQVKLVYHIKLVCILYILN